MDDLHADFALAGSVSVERRSHWGNDLAWIESIGAGQDNLSELYLLPESDNTSDNKVFDVTFRLADVLLLEEVALQRLLSPCWLCTNTVETGPKILQKLLKATFHEERPYGLLLECCQDKAGTTEDGLENPFVQDINYPLPPICYFLIYSELDSNDNTRVFARLFQIHEHPADSIIAQCGKLTGRLTDTSMVYEWDVLAAYDEDNLQKEKQIQRPEFFAKPRPKLIAKKRQALDLKALKKPQDGSKGIKGSPRKPAPSGIALTAAMTTVVAETSASASFNPVAGKPATKVNIVRKAPADTWESENKNIMKRRVWDKVLKRGFDKRSQQTKLIYQHIYQSIQYVFRRTIKDEEVDMKVMDQVIEGHLQFYEDMNKIVEGI